MRQLSKWGRRLKWFVLVLLAVYFVYSVFVDPSLIRYVLIGLQLLLQLAFGILFMIIQFVALFYFLARPRMYLIRPGEQGVTLEDYKGNPEVVKVAERFVALLQGQKEFERAGGEPQRGLLLYGKPGTGKTYLGQCMASAGGGAFYYVDCSGLRSMFWGVDILIMYSVWRKARKAAREWGSCILFMDEFDSIGMRRGGMEGEVRPVGMWGGASGGALNTLLQQMSGFHKANWKRRLLVRLCNLFRITPPPPPVERVLCVASTNRPDVLDPALRRPGRFDKEVAIDPPVEDGRREIVRYYLDKIAHNDSMEDIDRLAQDSAGMTPADIKGALNDALARAIEESRMELTYDDWLYVFPERHLGLRQPIPGMGTEDRRHLAYHEAGHGLTLLLVMPEHRLRRLSIVRHGRALGHADHVPIEERHTAGAQDLAKRLCVVLGGRAAELEFLGDAGMGAANDLDNAQAILATMARLWMAGTKAWLQSGLARMGSEQGKTELSDETVRYCDDLLARVRGLLRANAERMHRLAGALMEKDELHYEEIQELLPELFA